MKEAENILNSIRETEQQISVDRVFGTPETVGEGRVIIPVAEVAYGFGMGFAAMTPDEVGGPVEVEDVEAAGEGAGLGGGGGGRARPLAYIEVGPEGTKIEPILDEQRVAMAGILLGAWTVGWLGLVLKALFAPRRS